MGKRKAPPPENPPRDENIIRFKNGSVLRFIGKEEDVVSFSVKPFTIADH